MHWYTCNCYKHVRSLQVYTYLDNEKFIEVCHAQKIFFYSSNLCYKIQSEKVVSE